MTITRSPEVPGVPLADEAVLAPLGAPTPHWPGRMVVAGGMRLHVREAPGRSGDTADEFVLVHGLGGSATNWTDLSAALSGRGRCLAVDLPGFGRSGPPADGDYSIAAHARAVSAFLDTLAGPVHLLGNSLGGVVALTVAAARPDRVRTLTLISPAMPDLRVAPSRLGDRRMALAALPLVGVRARTELAAEDPATRLGRTMRLCYADPSRVTPAAFAIAVGEAGERAAMPWVAAALQGSFVGLVARWFAPRSRSLWSAAAHVVVPTLVVWGESDRLVSVRKARRTVAALSAGRLLRLPDTGHVAQMERPVLVARAVIGMLDAVAVGAWRAAAGAPALPALPTPRSVRA